MNNEHRVEYLEDDNYLFNADLLVKGCDIISIEDMTISPWAFSCGGEKGILYWGQDYHKYRKWEYCLENNK